ncbi:uncharacterized protein LOC133388847 isoform X2 [Rhineura floridana]|uniref:uncharacterized protein LOC133388847 isoform X2 n=1 Tax=Rhineura floridana TaxID=261503 RepID=UPI002AC862E7|nr:uncharacterized protein LOC133388847 isoform X2 [Rhineura floridana]
MPTSFPGSPQVVHDERRRYPENSRCLGVQQETGPTDKDGAGTPPVSSSRPFEPEEMQLIESFQGVPTEEQNKIVTKLDRLKILLEKLQVEQHSSACNREIMRDQNLADPIIRSSGKNSCSMVSYHTKQQTVAEINLIPFKNVPSCEESIPTIRYSKNNPEPPYGPSWIDMCYLENDKLGSPGKNVSPPDPPGTQVGPIISVEGPLWP